MADVIGFVIRWLDLGFFEGNEVWSNESFADHEGRSVAMIIVAGGIVPTFASDYGAAEDSDVPREAMGTKSA